MSDFQYNYISDLAKKYSFETFDFKTGSPEQLLKLYQDTFDLLEEIVEKQDSERANKHIAAWFKS